MASAADIATLRRLVAEPDNTTYSDNDLSALIDTNGMDGAAYEVWVQKAASLSSAVTISEGGSTRQNSDLIKNAQSMAGVFAARRDAADSTSAHGGTRISKIRRT